MPRHWPSRPSRRCAPAGPCSCRRNGRATFFNWMENIQPWCISRQIWWGHQIPAWYGPDGKIFVAENEDDAVADARAHYTEIEEITVERGPRHRRRPERRARFANEYLSATTTCSTPGSPRRCGRSRRSAGPTRRRSWSASIRPACWSPASTSSSSGSRA